MMGIRLLEQYYDSSTYYGRNYTASDATGALFRNAPVHWAETGGRLWDMCDWKEKLEVTPSGGIWIRPENEAEMRIELREEQQLLPQERERLEKERRQTEVWRRKRGIEKKREERVDDALYAALRTVILEKRPVCLAKEGVEPGGRVSGDENQGKQRRETGLRGVFKPRSDYRTLGRTLAAGLRLRCFLQNRARSPASS